ncbi:MAG: molybdenum cofactor guanylyltransferase [Nitrospirae bacterium]|nr:molybdenum cofactor guanylyltransferase [Nitrospirota bacterium]
MTGIVLSGGENRRMGRDKAFLKLEGAPLIEHVLRALRAVFPRIIIVTNAPSSYVSYDALAINDAVDKRGPLTGIYTGLLNSTDEYNFVAACDMPFLNPDLIAYMAGLADGHDIVVPKIAGRVEPLHAIYSKGLLPLIEKRLQGDARNVQGIFGEARVRYVRETEIDSFDPEHRSFKNLNTPEEYKEATCLDLECRS